jgi:hypothetical protein
MLVGMNLHTPRFSSHVMSFVAPARITILRNRYINLIPYKIVTMKFSSVAIAAVAVAASGVSAFSTPAKFGVRQYTALQMATAIDSDTKTALATAANEARGMAMDSIAAAKSGHMGLPLGCGEIGAVLYGSQVCLLL